MTTGPYETEAQARETAAVQEIHRAFRAEPGVGRMARTSTPCQCQRSSTNGSRQSLSIKPYLFRDYYVWAIGVW